MNGGQIIESKHMPVELLVESNDTILIRSDVSTKIFKIVKFRSDKEKCATFMDHPASPDGAMSSINSSVELVS